MSANRRYRSAAAETACVDSVIAVADRTSAKRCLHHGTHVASASSPAMLLLTLPGPPVVDIQRTLRPRSRPARVQPVEVECEPNNIGEPTAVIPNGFRPLPRGVWRRAPNPDWIS